MGAGVVVMKFQAVASTRGWHLAGEDRDAKVVGEWVNLYIEAEDARSSGRRRRSSDAVFAAFG